MITNIASEYGSRSWSYNLWTVPLNGYRVVARYDTIKRVQKRQRLGAEKRAVQEIFTFCCFNKISGSRLWLTKWICPLHSQILVLKVSIFGNVHVESPLLVTFLKVHTHSCLTGTWLLVCYTTDNSRKKNVVAIERELGWIWISCFSITGLASEAALDKDKCKSLVNILLCSWCKEETL